MNIEESLEYLKEHYQMSVMSHSGERKWFNLSSANGVGCILEEKEGNITFTMCFTLPYGDFKHIPMHVNYLGKASDLAYQRVSNIYHAIKFQGINEG